MHVCVCTTEVPLEEDKRLWSSQNVSDLIQIPITLTGNTPNTQSTDVILSRVSLIVEPNLFWAKGFSGPALTKLKSKF